MSNYCNGTCPMYDAENGECCATDGPRVSVKPDAECFFDAYELDNPFVPPKPTNADRIRSLSDEELAREMLFFVPSDFNRHYTGIAGGYYATADEAIQANFDWLKQPVKEE